MCGGQAALGSAAESLRAHTHLNCSGTAALPSIVLQELCDLFWGREARYRALKLLLSELQGLSCGCLDAFKVPL